METYEQKYKEALEKAKNMINDLRKGEDILAVSELETMFPELVESEDEKVRKAIIELLNTIIKGKKVYSIADTTRSEMIAWLENIPYTIDHEKREGFRLGYKAGLEKQGQTFTKKDVDDAYLKGVSDTKHELEKQSEKSQRMISAEAKEALWSDKYEGLTDFERTLADICIGWIGEELGWKQYIKDNADVLLKIAIEKFNSVQDIPFEQKPAEWSEEDEVRLQACLDTLQAKSLFGVVDTQMTKWLKSLKDRVQPIHEYSDTEKQEMFIKSQRPHFWKPTDEQMKALSEASGIVGMLTPRGTNLQSLYNDLKKLREGEL